MISYLVCHEAVECEGALTVDSAAYHIPPRPCVLVLRLEPIRHPPLYKLPVARLMGG